MSDKQELRRDDFDRELSQTALWAQVLALLHQCDTAESLLRELGEAVQLLEDELNADAGYRPLAGAYNAQYAVREALARYDEWRGARG